MELHAIGNWITEHPLKLMGLFIAGLLFFWLLGNTILILLSPQLLYNTKASYAVTPDILYEQIWLTDNKHRKIDLVWIPNANATQTVLYLHGNHGRLSHFFPQLHAEYNVLAPAYPGFHESTGSPSTKSIYSTALLAYDYLMEQGINQEDIIIFGHSMGGSPAVYTAAQRPAVGKLVLLNTFYNIFEMCWQEWNVFCTFSLPILNTAHYAPQVHNKLRQYHFINDDVVPYSQGEKLFTKFTGTQDKKFTTLEGDLTHSDVDVLAVVRGE